MNKKKILLTSFTYPPEQNGVAHAAQAQAEGLRERGHDVQVATALRSDNDPNCVNRVPIRRFSVSGNGLCVRGRLKGDVLEYQRHIISSDPDILISHCWQNWATNAALAILPTLRAKKILISHGVSGRRPLGSLGSVLNWIEWMPYWVQMRKWINLWDHIVLLTSKTDSNRFWEKALIQKLGKQNYSIIPNGVQSKPDVYADQRPAQFRKKLGMSANARILLNVSNFEKLKNQIEAIEILHDLNQPNLHLILIGSVSNAYSAFLKNRILELKLSDRVHILWGLSVQDIQAAYSAASVFVFTSLYEIQPLVLLESIAAGTPFIAYDVGCVDEIPGGIVTRSKSEMSAKLKELLEDEHKRHALKMNGLEAAKERYNLQTSLEKLNRLIVAL